VPAPPILDDIELIIQDIGGGGGKKPPLAGFGGDDEGKRKPQRPTSPRRYYTGIALAIISILMFFMALASAYVVRKGSSGNEWIPFHFPILVWANTAVLLASSCTLEIARRKIASAQPRAFRNWWSLTTILGLLFLAGQLIVWRQLVAQGVYVASNPSSSFFYIFTGAHAIHVFGGVAALLFVLFRNFHRAKVSQFTAAGVTAYFWHFLDALWLFLLALLYLGK
jgi:cytochrome c oxidase subunit 3